MRVSGKQTSKCSVTSIKPHTTSTRHIPTVIILDGNGCVDNAAQTYGPGSSPRPHRQPQLNMKGLCGLDGTVVDDGQGQTEQGLLGQNAQREDDGIAGEQTVVTSAWKGAWLSSLVREHYE